MAFVDTDQYGDSFVNVTARTGATGNWDDLMVVQAMLLEYWKNIKETHRVVPKAPAVDGGIHKETTLLIAEFQRRYMHRPKPQGFINPAMAANKNPSTIWNLNQFYGTATRSYDPVGYLMTTYPALRPLLQPPIPHEEQEN